MKDYFTILGVPRSAREDEIKEAYRALAKQWHPDNNATDPTAAKVMLDLNHAKEVLFTKETREEYLRLLRLQDSITPEHVGRIARKYVRDYDRTSRTLASFPKFNEKRFIIVVIMMVVGIAGAIYVALRTTSAAPEQLMPVQAILQRQQSLGTEPRQRPDTSRVPDVPADRLSQMAALLAMMEEHTSAAKYWEKALAQDSANAEIFTNLLLNLLKRYEYRRAFALVERFAPADSARIIVWNNIGEYLLVEGRRADARDAFRNALLFARRIAAPPHAIQRYIANAEAQLQHLGGISE